MKRTVILFSFLIMMVSCGNPFLTQWDTPYGIPDFSRVKEKHYLPAVEEGIRQQQAEIDAIIANGDAPTFENVVGAYERSGAILDRVIGVLFNLSETDGTDNMQAVMDEDLPAGSVPALGRASSRVRMYVLVLILGDAASLIHF